MFAASFTAALFLTVSPRAEPMAAQDIRYALLSVEERILIDRIAADFFENDLRAVQAEAIENLTAEMYRRAGPVERAAFRDARRAQWRAVNPKIRTTLSQATRPRYDNLTEAQKEPFRRHALNRLEAVGAIDPVALAAALADGI
jgi:hypothetical protein